MQLGRNNLYKFIMSDNFAENEILTREIVGARFRAKHPEIKWTHDMRCELDYAYSQVMERLVREGNARMGVALGEFILCSKEEKKVPTRNNDMER